MDLFIRAAFTVVRKEYITSHYLRIFLTGDHVFEIADTTVGINNKIIIPPAETTHFTMPKMNPETKVLEYADSDATPIIRTYTHRGIDLEKMRFGLILSFMAMKVWHRRGRNVQNLEMRWV